MQVIPAVDIINGKCVRLYRGDYSKESIYSNDPVAVALKWQALGATWLHIVDLDGAASGESRNAATIESIVKQVGLPVQLGGGIRSESAVKRLLDIGIKWVILGTVALEQPELMIELCNKFGEAIVVSIDARDGYVATHGWLRDTEIKALALAR